MAGDDLSIERSVCCNKAATCTVRGVSLYPHPVDGKTHRDLAPAIGRTVAAERQAQGLTQAELAERSRVGKTTISYLENGHRLPDFTTLVNLLEALGLSLYDLAAAVEGPRPTEPPKVAIAEPTTGYDYAERREVIRAEVLSVLDELITSQQRRASGE